MRASHILIEHQMKWPPAKRNHPRTREQADALIEDLIQQLFDGVKFATLAKKHSNCPSSRNGGDLGRFSFDQMTKPFSEAAFALEVGQLSVPVRTEFGVHLILRTE